MKSADGKRCIAVDDKLAAELDAFLIANPKANKKFDHIKKLLVIGSRVPDLYDKEEIDAASKGVRAMKLLKGSQNARIYCREVFFEGRTFIIIASELIRHKGSQKNSHREITAIHRVASYEYTMIHEQ